MTAQVAPLRSRTRDGEATRDVILAAAAALLAAGGEEGFSIRELCARAGVTAPTVYHHFGDKAALVTRVIDGCFEEFDRAAAAGGGAWWGGGGGVGGGGAGGAAAPRPPADPVEALRWGFDRYVEYGTTHPSHYRVLFAPPLEEPSAAAASSHDPPLQGARAVAAPRPPRSPAGGGGGAG